MASSSSKLHERMSSLGIPRPLCPFQSVDILVSGEYAERDVQFSRRYFGGLPKIKKLRTNRRSPLYSLPKPSTLNIGHLDYVWQEPGRSVPPSVEVREIPSAVLNVSEVKQIYLENTEIVNIFPHPPTLYCVSENDFVPTVIFQLSIDSGRGMKKVISRFVLENQGQSVMNILLLGEAHSTNENFHEVSHDFVTIDSQLNSMMDYGVIVNGRHYFVRCLFVGDFTLLYAILGIVSTAGRLPCP